jgi:hypothetical protein
MWSLGEPDDPERGVMTSARLAPGERIAARDYSDWTALLVMAGSLKAGDHSLAQDDFVRIAPGSRVPELAAGSAGATVLTLARTAVDHHLA